jgi:signal transduction histidine kinase
MRVGQRLFLTVVPAIVGLLTVVALMYFGEYARQAPEWLVALAVAASLGSAILAQRNARYVTQRIESLASHRAPRAEVSGAVRRATSLLGAALRPHSATQGEADELDDIEQLLAQLTESLAHERRSSAMLAEATDVRMREYHSLVGAAVHGGLHALEEVRLPLHILLENRFGELNENQEEMLGAARAAADAADAALLQLRDVVQLDAGTLRVREERVRLQDVIAVTLPALRAAAAKHDVELHADISPALPALRGDRGRLQDALAALLLEAINAATPHAILTLRGSRDRKGVQLTCPFGTRGQLPDAYALATRIIRAHGGEVKVSDGTFTVHLPVSGESAALA